MTERKLTPIHPGEVLREEFIKPLGMRQREFVEKIGVTYSWHNKIVNEKRSITTDTALPDAGNHGSKTGMPESRF